MICSWCRVEYEGNPLYHICPDGSTFDVRRERTEEEILNEYERQDAVKDPDKIFWTGFDIEFLKGCRIKR